MIRAGRFFLPGPVEVRPEILAAASQPMISHRGADMKALMRRVGPRLGALFGTTRGVHVLTGSGTSAMELAIRNGSIRRVLSVVHGDFGERFSRIAESCGRVVERLSCAPGDVVEPDAIRDALRRGSFDAVTVTYSETSTGALADVAGVASVVREFDDCLLLVDAVSAAAAVPCRLDEWGAAAIVSASQKALALPPGLAFAAVSERLVERARKLPASDRGVYLDVLRHEKATADAQSPTTPAVGLLFALDRQLADIEGETLDARFGRHEAMSASCAAWLARVGGELGVASLAAPAHRSPSVTCFTTRTSPAVVLQRMRERGYTLGGGQAPVKDTTFRIGHMGDHTVAGVEGALGALEDALRSG